MSTSLSERIRLVLAVALASVTGMVLVTLGAIWSPRLARRVVHGWDNPSATISQGEGRALVLGLVTIVVAGASAACVYRMVRGKWS